MPVMWAINTTFHITLKASPAQLAFNHDMILPTSFTTNWYAINNRKQAQSQSATDTKNRKCILHKFCLNDKVLICHDIGNPYLGKLANLHKVLSKLSLYNNYQSMVPFLYSDCQLLLSASTFNNCCHFLNGTIEDVNVVPWPL
jgi:hypothetical protein